MKQLIKRLTTEEQRTVLSRLVAGAELTGMYVAGHFPSQRVRAAALRALGAEIDREAVIYHGLQVRCANRLRIGPRTNIGEDAVLDARGGLTLGADVNLSTGVQVWSDQHDWRAPDFRARPAPVLIADRVWLGPRVIVLPGSTIGEGAVVAAGAVVRGKVAPYTLVGGVPARKLGERPRDLTYRLPKRSEAVPWW